MTRRMVAKLFIVCAVIAIALVLTLKLAHTPIVKASGTPGPCLGLCSPPNPPATCISGGTNPVPGQSLTTLAYSAGPGQKPLSYMTQASGCFIHITGLDANWVTSGISTNSVGSVIVWESSSITCSPVIRYNYISHMAVNQYHPADHILTSKGGVATSQTPGSYVCAGFTNIDPNGAQSIQIYWDVE